MSNDDWKSLIFEHTLTKRQLGIYDRKNMILVRLEKYNTDINGVVIYPKTPKGDSWEHKDSKFKGGKGVCVQVDTVENFKDLLNWYCAVKKTNFLIGY